jgi:hypothetical protein
MLFLVSFRSETSRIDTVTVASFDGPPHTLHGRLLNITMRFCQILKLKKDLLNRANYNVSVTNKSFVKMLIT